MHGVRSKCRNCQEFPEFMLLQQPVRSAWAPGILRLRGQTPGRHLPWPPAHLMAPSVDNSLLLPPLLPGPCTGSTQSQSRPLSPEHLLGGQQNGAQGSPHPHLEHASFRKLRGLLQGKTG